MIDIKKYELSTTGICAPVVIATWGGIKGNIEDQQDLVDYVSSHGGGGGGDTVWGSITGNIKDQTDLYDNLEGIITWVRTQGYITSSALSGYATESYVDEAIEGAITDGSGGYIWDIPIQDIQGQVNELGNALGVIESNYVTMSDVSSEISTALSGYATESYVQNQGYITSSALSGYATESWVSSQGYASDSDLTSLASRVTTLETNYGDAITITNNILG